MSAARAVFPGFLVSPSSRLEVDVLSFPLHQPLLRYVRIWGFSPVWLPALASSETSHVDTSSGRCHPLMGMSAHQSYRDMLTGGIPTAIHRNTHS
jgi:hypothetical protein